MAFNVGVVIVSAGKGRRLGRRDKAVLKLGNEPLFYKSIAVFRNIKAVKQIVLVLKKSNFSAAKKVIGKRPVTLAEGGKERRDSVLKGLISLRENINYVLIHDAARPFVGRKLIFDILRELKRHPAVICAAQAPDTVKLTRAGFIKKTLNRENIFLAQTPQGFRKDLILRAYRRSYSRKFTDDAQAAEEMGERVKIVPGDSLNFKITYPRDVRLARIIDREKI